jgi:hypothetical protein
MGTNRRILGKVKGHCLPAMQQGRRITDTVFSIWEREGTGTSLEEITHGTQSRRDNWPMWS